jgi:7,8-dihydropterin-6-yl-methyl-4-(beta-D-ribofuranosyl)aminobenzene 5'-phosphate synthase
MTRQFNRRDTLKMSASFALSAAAGGLSCVEIARAGPIEVPTIDKLSVRVLVDSASDIFLGLQGIEWVILRDRSGGSGCG